MKDKLNNPSLWATISHKIRMENIDIDREIQSTCRLLRQIELLIALTEARKQS